MTLEEAKAKFPIGTKVKYYSLRGESNHINTVIRSDPWALGWGGIIIKVEGVNGGVSVKHLELIVEIDS